MCYSPWGRKESDTTEQLNLHSLQDLSSLGSQGISFMVILNIADVNPGPTKLE